MKARVLKRLKIENPAAVRGSVSRIKFVSKRSKNAWKSSHSRALSSPLSRAPLSSASMAQRDAARLYTPDAGGSLLVLNKSFCCSFDAL